LWFGNQHAKDDENPTYGTARVLAAYRDLRMMDTGPAQRGVAWLLAAQNADGGWGGAAGTPSSIEETALAVEVLLDAVPRERGKRPHLPVPEVGDGAKGSPGWAARRKGFDLVMDAWLHPKPPPEVMATVNKGLAWLVGQVEAGGIKAATPIGFYFANLWYFEKLYPIIFTVAALGRARRKLSPTATSTKANARRTDTH
jgi:squalene-hopene/tetraprenyl-beta-curcumene cyclase